ncbi:CocE/NonD family hydrolase [Nocardia sp. NPDC058058]|uniref:CocE/NonD family hydrolase n=1 Tax=Nocardia sp. NPDC058058 TaxID=3346317 RepID=UPI0036D889E8
MTRWIRLLLRSSIVLLAPILIGAGLVVPARAVPDGGDLAAAWLATYEAPPKYPSVYIDWDVPITMSDGTVLKANIYHPADANGPITEPTPTTVSITPYTKLMQMLLDSAVSIPVLYDAIGQLARMLDFSAVGLGGLTDMLKIVPGGAARMFAGVDRKLIQSGYTQIVVDARGTGFSQGSWTAFSPTEQHDGTEIVDWAARQPWSTGKIGMTGYSYTGISQLQTAQQQPSALRALFAVNAGNDLTQDFIATGGALGMPFLAGLLAVVNAAKFVPDMVAVLSGKFDWKWFQDRVSSPFSMLELFFGYILALNPDMMPQATKDVLTPSSTLRTAWAGGTDKIQAPTLMVGGWHDLFTYSQVRAFNNIPLPADQKKLIMADTYHFNGGSNFGAPGLPPRLDVLQRAWFDKWLKDIDNGIDTYDPYVVKQQGGDWIGLPQFPRPEAEYTRMYLSAAPSGNPFPVVHDGSLTPAVTEDRTRLTISPGILPICSRDGAIISGGAIAALDLCGRDSRVAEANALTFTSTPVAEPTTISGPIALRLNTVHDTSDGVWTATINDVAPDGQSTALSTGQLIASLRKIDDTASTRSPNGDYTDPYPELSLTNRQPTIPGQPTTLDIRLNAVEAILQPGHRLRVDVFASNFPRSLPPGLVLADSQLAPQHIQLDPDAPSFVNVPLTGRPGW